MVQLICLDCITIGCNFCTLEHFFYRPNVAAITENVVSAHNSVIVFHSITNMVSKPMFSWSNITVVMFTMTSDIYFMSKIKKIMIFRYFYAL